MKRRRKLYEGKAKQVYATSDPKKIIVYYKDEATAGDGLKRGIIQGKGSINCEFSSIIYRMLEKKGVATHYIDQVSPDEMLCWRVDILPVEVIIRNIVAGGLAKRMGMDEGRPLKKVILEHCYKNDELHDPIVNTWHIEAFGFATRKQYERMNEISMKVNRILKPFFDKRGVLLVDYKLEFGMKGNRILLADEITPDGCRFWDKKTKRKMDKDRFRRDMGGIEDAYKEILERIKRR